MAVIGRGALLRHQRSDHKRAALIGSCGLMSKRQVYSRNMLGSRVMACVIIKRFLLAFRLCITKNLTELKLTYIYIHTYIEELHILYRIVISTICICQERHRRVKLITQWALETGCDKHLWLWNLYSAWVMCDHHIKFRISPLFISLWVLSTCTFALLYRMIYEINCDK